MAVGGQAQRDEIWHELHARPYVRFSAPAHVLRLSFFLDSAREDSDRERLQGLAQAMALRATYETDRHSIYATTLAGVGRLVLSWERHSEFIACTLILYELEIPFVPFAFDLQTLLPKGWLESLRTPPLVATRLAVGPAEQMPQTLERLAALFEGHTVNGSQVMAGRGEVWSCYRAHGDGLGRIALVVRETMSPQELGRTTERLLAIEDFYHLTLLPLPLARNVKAEVSAAESRMVLEMDVLRKADSVEQKRAVLDALLELAAEVEHLRAQVSNPFARASAYFSLLENRFAELREGKIEHVLSLSRFVMRRVRPAAATYRDLLERLTGLSERINRAGDLLRTSIELHVEEQNVRLLESADRRAGLQLRLQQAVEVLSVIVITYYALGLAEYALRGLRSRGLAFDLDATLGLAMPVLLLVVCLVVYLVHRRFRDEP